MSKELILYNYFRSSTSYRVRLALHLKSLEFEYKPVNLKEGEQNSAWYKEIYPSSEVPTLLHNEIKLSQSLPIIEYLDEVFPEPKLFPVDPVKKAKVRQICEMVNSGIHPIQNLKVLQKLENDFAIKDKFEWARYWIARGFQGLEIVLQETSGLYSFGDQLTAADLFIVPQVFNANRFGVDMASFPILNRIEASCQKLEAFKKAHPNYQPDSE